MIQISFLKIFNKRRVKLFAVLTAFLAFNSFATAQNEFEAWKKTTIDSFQKYKDERDGEFVKFLKQRWVEFQTSKGFVRDKTPKPEKIPVAAPKSFKPIIPGEKKVEIKIPVHQPLAVRKPINIPEPAPDIQQKSSRLGLLFHNTPLTIYFDADFQFKPIDNINQKSISAFWDKMSRADYEIFIAQAQEYKNRLQLNDWGYHYLLYETGKHIYQGNRNMTYLFVWFMASKSGYESRVGYADNHIYLLMPASTKIFGTPYLTLKGKRFYALFFNQEPEHFKKIFTYKGTYPDADKPMDYRIGNLPLLSVTLKQRDLKFKYKGKAYSIPMIFNRNLIDFLEYYPQTTIDLYFNARVSPEIEHSLIKGLKPLIENRSERDAVGLLLRFTQTAFDYKTDGVQFGREKYLLPEETLYYPFSDCEDRSLLFSRLVEKLIGIEIVGLSYPGHIATAVKLSGEVRGDFVTDGNVRYIICDPTYINADIGMAMPRFKNVNPEIIVIKSSTREG